MSRKPLLSKLMSGRSVGYASLAVLVFGVLSDVSATAPGRYEIADGKTNSGDPYVPGKAMSDSVLLHYGTAVDHEVDISIPTPGGPIGHTRSYSSGLTNGGLGHGTNWLAGRGNDGLAKVGGNVHWDIRSDTSHPFVDTGSSYTPPADSDYTMLAPSGNFEVRDRRRRRKWFFNPLDHGTYGINKGRLIADGSDYYAADPDGIGAKGTEFGYHADGYLETMTSYGDDYTETNVADSTERITSSTAKKGAAEQAKVEFTYRLTTDHADLGPVGALVLVKTTQKASNGTTDMTSYRHYRYDSDGRRKAEFDEDAMERLLDAGLANATTVLSKADTDTVGGTQVQNFASRSFTYYTSNVSTNAVTTSFQTNEDLQSRYGGTNLDETGRVKSVIQRSGQGSGCCGSGSSGQVTKNFYYMEINAGSSTFYANETRQITVIDTVDSAGVGYQRAITATNADGTELRQVLVTSPVSSPKFWCRSKILDTTSKRVTESRHPSAHNGNVTTEAQLRTFLDPFDSVVGFPNDVATLDTDGVIEINEYTSLGLPQGRKIKNGSGGTAYYVWGADYGDGTTVPTDRIIREYSYSSQQTTRTSGDATDYTYTFWDTSTKLRVKTIDTQAPSVSTSENGSGVRTTTKQYFDEHGRLRWSLDGEEYVTYYSYYPESGLRAITIQDVDTSSLPSLITSTNTGWIEWSGAAPFSRGASNPGTALNHATRVEYDSQGRVYKETDPSGSEHYTLYLTDATNGVNRVARFRYWDGATSKPLLPIEVSESDYSGTVLSQYTLKPTAAVATSSLPTGITATQSNYLSWTKNTYNTVNGQLEKEDRYFLIPSSGTGSLLTNFHRTVYVYDDMGRPATTVSVIQSGSSFPVEQVTKQEYDSLGRVVRTKKGVSSGTHDMGVSYTSLPTLATVSETVYDGGNVGDGLVTVSLNYHDTGSTDNTGTRTYYDYRGRVRGSESVHTYNTSTHACTVIGPYSVQDLNWQGQATANAVFTSAPTWTSVISNDTYAASTTSSRRSLSKSYFDKLGRTYRTESFRVATSTGATDGASKVDTYFDRNGQAVGSAPAHSAATETAYDGLGRSYQTRTVVALESTLYPSGRFNYRAPEPKPSVSTMTGGDDNLLAMSHTEFDSAGRSIGQHAFEMTHKDTNGLSMSDTTSYVRSTQYVWYDAADRVTTTGNYGSGDSGGLWKHSAYAARNSTAPTASSSTVLVSTVSYDVDTGREDVVTDPKAKKTKSFYDSLGQVTHVADNWVDFSATGETGSGDATDKSKDNVVKREYDGAGNVVKLIAMDQDANGNLSDNQTTQYYREDAYDASLVTKESYPDSTGGTDVVSKTYGLDGRIKQMTDQRGVVIDYTYTNSYPGRPLLSETATTVPAGIDTSIRQIKRTYDMLARPDKLSSCSDTSGSTVVNEIQWSYLDNLSVNESKQDHNGVVDANTPKVLYTYDTTQTSSVFNNGLRLSQVTSPSGKYMIPSYSGTIPDALHRVSSIGSDHSGIFATRASYSYNGVGHLVKVNYSTANINLLRDAADDGTYENLDLYGQIKSQLWKTTGGTVVDQFDYTYDYAGNRLSRDVASNTTKDQGYSYDGLHRLKTMDQGNWTAGAIATANYKEDWTLDGLGNWSTFKHDDDGSGSYSAGETQARTHNSANEVTAIDGSGSNVAHDAAGNMTSAPKSSGSGKFDLKWDAWNRLVEVKDGSTVVATYAYDGQHRRISKTVGSDTDHFYYNEQWQCLEIRRGTETSAAKQEFVWHPYYVDALAIRYENRDGTAGYSGTDEAQIALHDANFNITAMTNTSASVRERYAYNPYGKRTTLDSDFSSDDDGVTIGNHCSYTGRELDGETGIYYYRARYYDAGLGRFVGRDPLDFSYVYCQSSPQDFVDPTGYVAVYVGKVPESPDVDANGKKATEVKVDVPCGHLSEPLNSKVFFFFDLGPAKFKQDMWLVQKITHKCDVTFGEDMKDSLSVVFWEAKRIPKSDKLANITQVDLNRIAAYVDTSGKKTSEGEIRLYSSSVIGDLEKDPDWKKSAGNSFDEIGISPAGWCKVSPGPGAIYFHQEDQAKSPTFWDDPKIKAIGKNGSRKSEATWDCFNKAAEEVGGTQTGTGSGGPQPAPRRRKAVFSWSN